MTTTMVENTKNLYDSLEARPDDPVPYMGAMTGTWYLGVPRGEDDPTADIIERKTAYQSMKWIHYGYDEKRTDTCLWLDGFLHSCNSIRPHVHELIIHYPASFLPKNSLKRVLYVGGGDLILLHEIMKYDSIELVMGTCCCCCCCCTSHVKLFRSYKKRMIAKAIVLPLIFLFFLFIFKLSL